MRARVFVAIATLALGGTTPERRAVRVCAGGDVTLGTNLDSAWMAGRTPVDPATLVAPLRAFFADADLALVNVEGAIGEGPSKSKCPRGSRLCYAFRMPPGAEVAIRGIAEHAVVVGNVANNHAHDAGDDGLAETLRRLGVAGVLATGADTLATPVAVADGDTIGVLGFSPWSVARLKDTAVVRRLVARAAERYGRVIVTMHAGAEGPPARHTPDRVEMFAGEDRGNSIAFARVAIDAGAHLVVGHGPHVMRAIEWRGDHLVAYSLGNLLTYGPFNLADAAGRAAVLCATMGADGRITDASLRSTRQSRPGAVSADATNAGAADVAGLSAADFPGTGAVVTRDGKVARRP